MRLKLIMALAIGMFFTFDTQAQTHTVGGVKFPDKLKIGEATTTYNGGGVRKKYFMSLYAAALYIPSKTTNAQTIINQNTESAVRINIVSKMVTRDRFVETVRDGFATSTEGKATQAEIDALMALFKEEFKIGDDIILAYRPNIGVEVHMNGKRLGIVKGLDFKKALWGIWLGSKPADSSVKKGLLGQ